ncbi:MAG TPA: WbqC family protein [Bacteroidia bacterium]|jgi:hypothetical protein|nr:WbqC family protein [Bacteroidia bacterium]
MKIGVIQSNYIPWRGYFDFIKSVDLFVIYDDVQYVKGSWRNRNQLKFTEGLKWITVPVKVELGMSVDEVKIGVSTKEDWKQIHGNQLKTSLGKTPFFNDAFTLWSESINKNFEYLTELNVDLIKNICSYLDIKTKIIFSRTLNLQSTKTERLMDLFSKTGATTYLSGPAADTYLDFELFRENKIRLEYKSYDYLPYKQHNHGDFSGAVSVLDLIANKGKESVNYISCQTPDKMIIEIE